MREIKFRAKGVDGEWWYGEDNPTKEYRHISLASFFTNLYAEQFNIKTLGQYTGLKDKNGREIYEGDTTCIEWRDAMYNAVITVAWDDNQTGFEPFCDYGVDPSAVEVIGNIYENPELLKEDS